MRLRAGPVLQPPSTARPGALAVGVARPASSPPARQRPNHGDGCPGTAWVGANPELRVTDGAGLAGGGKRPPCSPGGAPQVAPRACALARPCAPPGGAIAKRLLPSGGGVRAAAARSGEAGSGEAGPIRAPRSPSREHTQEAPRLCLWRLRFPRQKGMAGIPREAVWCVGRLILMPAPDCGPWPASQGPLLSEQRFLICKVGLKELRISTRLRIASLADPCQAPDP